MERFWNFCSCCCAILGFKLFFVFFCSIKPMSLPFPSLGSIFSEFAELRFHIEGILWKYLPHAHEVVSYNWSKAISVSDFGNPTGLCKDRCGQLSVILQGFKHLFHGLVLCFQAPFQREKFHVSERLRWLYLLLSPTWWEKQGPCRSNFQQEIK